MAVDMELVRAGRKEPRIGVVTQLAVSIALAVRHAVVLEPWGWTPADTAKLQAIHDKLKSDMAAQAEAKDRSKQATLDQTAAFSKAKKLKRLLDRARRAAFRANRNLPATADAFEAGGPIGVSVPKMLAYLIKVLPAVRALEGELKKRMGGLDPVAAVETATKDLQGADVNQETQLRDLPGETLEVYEAKGLALKLLADLNDAGRNAFDDDAAEAAKFNKDLIVRARKQRPAAEPAPA